MYYFYFFPKESFFLFGGEMYGENQKALDSWHIFPRDSWKMPTCDIITTTFLGMKMVLRCAWKTPLKPSMWSLCWYKSFMQCGSLCVLEEDTKCMSCSRDWNGNWKLGQFYASQVAREIWFSDRGIWHRFSVFNTHPNTHSLIIHFMGEWK